ncbi:MAG: hypothetical protein ACXU8N_10885 [Telluria sp.]
MAAASRSIRSAYRTTAVVDWLALEIETQKPTQFQWIQRTLADHFGNETRTFTEAVDAGAGNVATRFLIRLNDACCRDGDTIRAALAALDRKYSLVGTALLKGLEVSLDFYPTDHTAREHLLMLVARLQMSLAAYGKNHRQVGIRPGGKRARADFLDGTLAPDPKQTFYVNDQDRDPVSWRVYHKITDRKGALPLEEHRARAEFTLQDAGLHKYGIVSLDDLVQRGFSGFGELMHFRVFRPMFEMTEGRSLVVRHALEQGTRRYRNLIARYPFGRQAYYLDHRTGKPRAADRQKLRVHSAHTRSDSELNHLVRDRLRDLSHKFRKKLEGNCHLNGPRCHSKPRIEAY